MAEAPPVEQEWTPTPDPNPTVVPGQMRSDCQEVPEPFTKADADKAETMEARLSTARVAAGCQVYWPAPFEVCGVIRTKYNALGGPNSFLKLPISNELTNPGNTGKRTEFMVGPIYWSAATGAHPVVNSFMTKWGSKGWEGGFLKYPTSDEIVNSDGAGRRQEFQGGAIFWHPTQNAQAASIGGAIRTKWDAAGGPGGPLGYPTSDEIGVTKNNGRYNNFYNGTVTWSQPTGARLLYAAIRDRWAQAGREDGAFGYPTTDEKVSGDGVGHYAAFEGYGSIYWYPVVGAWPVPGRIFALWKTVSYELGELGYPRSAPQTLPSGIIRQMFEHGFAAIAPDGQALMSITD